MRSTAVPTPVFSAAPPRLAVVAFALALSACQPREGTEAIAESSGQQLAPDSLLKGGGRAGVWSLPCRQELLLPGKPGWPPRPPAIAPHRAAAGGGLACRVHLHPKRLVWEAPTAVLPRQGNGPLTLVLAPKSKVVLLVDHEQKRYWADTPAQIAAWMEGALRPARPPLSRIETLAAQPMRAAARGPTGRLAGRLDRALLVLTPPGPRAHKLHYLSLTSRASGASPAPASEDSEHLLWDFALLSLLPATGLPLLAQWRSQLRRPAAITVGARPQARHPGPHLRLHLDWEARHQQQLAAAWLRIPPGPDYERRYGPLVYPEGRSADEPPKTSGGPKASAATPKARLTVRNSASRALLIYAGGRLLGVVGPRSTYTFVLARKGYHRLVARSLFTPLLWGPRDLWVPGRITIRPGLGS